MVADKVVIGHVGLLYIFAFLFFFMCKPWVLGYVNGDIYDQEVGTAVTCLRLNVPLLPTRLRPAICWSIAGIYPTTREQES